MNAPNHIAPPKWATRLLRWYCKPELLEDLEGDLHEYYQRNAQARGIRTAKLIYVIDVIKFFRSYTIRKPKFIDLLFHQLMIATYIKVSGRSILRHKLFSFINVFGLAVSMSVGLVLITLLTEIFSYDHFHENRANIYRVLSRYEYLGSKDNDYMATSSRQTARLLAETVSQPQAVAVLRNDFGGTIGTDEKTIPLSGYYANPEFFTVFSFPLLRGNPHTALKEPFSLLLTEESALKLFGTNDVLGKTVKHNKERDYVITGVLKNVPRLSHMRFDMLASLSTRDILAGKDDWEFAWDNMWSAWVYVLLPPNTDLPALQAQLDQISQREDKTITNTHIQLALQPMHQIMLRNSASNEIGPTFGSGLLWVFGGLTGIVLLSAFFNYNNLSIARSLRRSKEIGIRKVIGAQKSSVILQFLIESVMLALAALVLALIFFFALKPFFLQVEPEISKIFPMEVTPRVILYFVGFALAVGLLAGIFPAMYFARVEIMNVLKGAALGAPNQKYSARKALIVFQYTISVVLICASLGAYRQYRHFVNFDLGYDTENVLNISLQGNRANVLINELEQLPEVKMISRSSVVTSIGSYWGNYVKYGKNPNDSISLGINQIDEYYIPLHKHKLIAGRNFAFKADSAAETEVILNRDALKQLNIAPQNPREAIGETILVNGKALQIIGVLEDFNYSRANEKVGSGKAVMFRYDKKITQWLNVKIESTDLLATYERIEKIWKKVDSINPFDGKFYDEQIAQSFSGLKATVKVAGFLAFLAICIASLGLLGMVIYTTEVRIKEISIRKVMGAGEFSLLLLLGKNFFLLLMLAGVIGITLCALFFETMVFTHVANSAPLNLTEMLLGVLAVWLLAGSMIASQTLRVARTNPAEVLKAE